MSCVTRATAQVETEDLGSPFTHCYVMTLKALLFTLRCPSLTRRSREDHPTRYWQKRRTQELWWKIRSNLQSKTHMDSTKWAYVLAHFVIKLISLGDVAAITVYTKSNISEFQNQDVILECNYTDPATYPEDRIVSWGKHEEAGVVSFYTLSTGYDPIVSDDYVNRVELTGQFASLKLQRLQQSDEGKYRCTVSFYTAGENDVGDSSVTVNAKLQQIEIFPKATSGAIDQQKTFTCTVPYVKPEVEIMWYIDSILVHPEHPPERKQDNYGVSNYTSDLTITPNKTHTGKDINIMCTAYQQEGDTKMSASATCSIPKDNTGAIAGGVVGGVVLLGAVISLSVWMKKSGKCDRTNT